MSLTLATPQQAIDGGFDAVIDARSPLEFAEDHLPGALNWPTLDDEQRRVVGTQYKQVNALEARKLGSVMAARNIAAHLEQHLADKPREWRPLVYCWRGGQRSGVLAWFLSQVGFRAAQLQGGYKAWRAVVREQLVTLPGQYRYQVLCGRTGSGKTRLLQALHSAGAQVLDLEALARHRGSVLGGLPGQPQPSQKAFDTAVWHALRGYNPEQPVYVESESKRIGALRVPEGLITQMRSHGQCVMVEMSDQARVQLLLQEYGFFAQQPEAFCEALQGLVELRGREQVQQWQTQALAGHWAELFAHLMQAHYDPLYLRSLRSSYAALDQARVLHLPSGEPEAMAQAAAQLLARGSRLS